jgi:flagellar protein FlaG
LDNQGELLASELHISTSYRVESGEGDGVMASDIVNQVNFTGVHASDGIAVQPDQVMSPRGIQAEPAPLQGEKEASDSEAEPTNVDMERVVVDVEQYVQNIRRNLNFSIEDDLGKTVIKVVDAETDELIRQIPSEEFLEIARALEKTKGLLMKSEA